MEPAPEQRRSTGLIVGIVGGIAGLAVLAGVAVWLTSDGFGGGSDGPATYQTQTTGEMNDFAQSLAALGEDAGFTADEAFGFTDDPAASNLNFHGQACERRAEVDHLAAISAAQLVRTDGMEAFLGVGFGNDADFHGMVSELIAGVEECLDGRELGPGNSLAPPQNVITDDGNPAKVRFSSDIASMGIEQTMLLLVYADGPVGIQVVMAAPEFVDDDTLDDMVAEAESFLDATLATIDDRGYLAPDR